MTLGVFLIHTNPIIYKKILYNCLVPYTSENLFVLLLIVLVACLSIYIICTIIDFIRILIFKLCRINSVLYWLQNKIEKLTEKLLKIGVKEDLKQD